MAVGQQKEYRMHQAFPRKALLALTVLGLMTAPVTALTAQAGKVRTATVGRIDGFTFFYTVQNQVAVCSAKLVNARGKTLAFTVRNGTRGKIYSLVQPRPVSLDPGDTATVQITSLDTLRWSGEMNGLAGQTDVEAQIPTLVGILSTTANFKIEIVNNALDQWSSSTAGWAGPPYTPMKRIFDGLDLCLMGRAVV